MAEVTSKVVDKFGDYALTPVPKNERKTLLNQFLVNAGYIICLAGLFSGASLGQGMTLKDAIIATIIGSFILALYASLTAVPAARYGVSTTVLGRHAFGRWGVVIIALIIFILNGVGWFAYETALFGLTLQEMFPGHFITNWQVASIWGGLLMMTTAIIGYRAIGVLSFLAVPLIATLSLAGLAGATSQVGGFSKLFEILPPGEQLTMATAITITVGYFAIGAACQPDIARYAKNEKVAVGAVFAGFLFANPLIMLAGTAMILVTSTMGVGTTPNLPRAMLELGLGAGALAVAALGQWTTNDNNLYTGSLALVNIIPLPKKILAAVVGIAGTIIAAIGIYEYWIPWLVFLGVFVPPMAGVMIADYYVLHRMGKKHYSFGPGTKYSKFDISGLLSFILAGLLAKYVIVSNIIPGAIIGLALGFILHVVLTYILEPIKLARVGVVEESEYGF